MKKTLTAIAAAAIAFAGFTGTASAEDEKFVLISHAPDSDSWWNTIKNAIKVAGDQMEVTVDYRNPPTGDLADMARIVEQAAATNPDGIIVTIAEPGAYNRGQTTGLHGRDHPGNVDLVTTANQLLQYA